MENKLAVGGIVRGLENGANLRKLRKGYSSHFIDKETEKHCY